MAVSYTHLHASGYQRGYSTPRWDTLQQTLISTLPVSYTHLDVYKRQSQRSAYVAYSRVIIGPLNASVSLFGIARLAIYTRILKLSR